MIKILDIIRKYFLLAVVAVLVILLTLERCNKPKPTPGPISVKRDTVWAVSNSTQVTKPVLIRTVPGDPEIHYIPDTSYAKLVLQYQALVKEYIANNTYKDSIKIDSIGYVNIIDNVSHNSLKDRKTSYSLKYPIITNTITVPAPKKNQLYIGGGLEYSPTMGQELNAGLLLKNKKDQIYSIYGGVNSVSGYQVGIQSYWKISFGQNK